MANMKAPPPPPKKSEAFENFERLTRQLMQVPKKELDEKMAEYERQKEQRKGPKKRT